jgi:hypothetical protein
MTSNPSIEQILEKYEGQRIKTDSDEQMDQFFVFKCKLHYLEIGAAEVCEKRGLAPQYLSSEEEIVLTQAPKGGGFNALQMEKILDELGISGHSNRCGVLAKDSCDMEKEISEGYSDDKVFIDIPYSSYEDCEDVLRDVLSSAGLNPVIAKGKVTSQVSRSSENPHSGPKEFPI